MTDKKNLLTAQQLCVVLLQMRIWTGKTVLQLSDFRSAGTEPLPLTVTDPGQKKLIDLERLNPFNALRQRAQRLLNDHGVPFLKGVAISLDEADGILEELDLIKEEFLREKAVFLQEYDRLVESWVSANPDFESQIRAGMKTKADVAERLDADYQVFRIEPISEKHAENLNRMVEDLGPKLLSDIASSADDVNRSSLLGRDAVSRKCLPSIERLRNKMRELSFLTNRVEPLIAMLERALAMVPATGLIRDRPLAELKTAVMILADKRLLDDFADGLISFDTFRDARFPEAAEDAAGDTPLFETEELPVSTPQKPAIAPTKPRASRRRAEPKQVEMDFDSLIADIFDAPAPKAAAAASDAPTQSEPADVPSAALPADADPVKAEPEEPAKVQKAKLVRRTRAKKAEAKPAEAPAEKPESAPEPETVPAANDGLSDSMMISTVDIEMSMNDAESIAMSDIGTYGDDMSIGLGPVPMTPDISAGQTPSDNRGAWF